VVSRRRAAQGAQWRKDIAPPAVLQIPRSLGRLLERDDEVVGNPRRVTLLFAVFSLYLAGCGAGSNAAKSIDTGSVSGAPAVQAASIVLDWYPNSDHGGLYTAMQRGYFAKRGVTVTPRVPSDTSAQIRLVAAGRAAFGFSYETDLLAARAHHVPVQSVMCIMQHPLDTVMSLKSAHITRPRDLIGKRIGMAGSPSDAPLVSAMMKHDGAPPSGAHLVNVGYNLLPALLSKRVDAIVGVYWTWEAIQAQMKGHPVSTMRVEQWGVPNYCELVLVASDSVILTQPALVRNTVQALQQGYAYAESHPQEAWNALHAADKTLDRGLVLRSLQLLRPVVTDAPTIGEQNGAQWRYYARWLTANKLISGDPDAAHAFTNRFLRANVR
jgi:ABC-type nitrate/sulfonate/bicarbonate transport system substrate-binding protein